MGETEKRKSLSPLEVRDALVQCFIDAHREAVEEAAAEVNATEDQKKGLIADMVRKAFVNSGGDFEHPTKKSIIAAMDNLKDVAKHFRNSELISKHYAKMLALVEKIK